MIQQFAKRTGWMMTAVLLILLMMTAQAGATQTTVTLGFATDDIFDEEKKNRALLDYLEAELKEVGIEKVDLLLAADNKNSTLIRYMKEGKLDIAMESALPSAEIVAFANAIPIVEFKRKKMKTSFVFVRKDSGIETVQDLEGKVVTFEDPGSTSGYFFPRLALQSAGIEMVHLESHQDPVPSGKLGFVFAGSELNVSTWVFFKKVAGGSLSSTDWEKKKYLPDNYKQAFKIILTSPPIPGSILTVRPDLDPQLRESIKQAFLRMNELAKAGHPIVKWKKKSEHDFAEISDELQQFIQRAPTVFRGE